MSARDAGLDRVRGAAIVLVVAGHVWRGLAGDGLLANTPAFRAIDAAVYLFHMPVFFLLAGLFFAPPRAPRPFLARWAARLVWPFLLWSWIEGAAHAAWGAPMGAWGILGYPWPPKSVFWFLAALAFIQVLVWAARRLPPQAAAALLVGLSAAMVAGIVPDPGLGMLWLGLVHLPWFAAGYLIGAERVPRLTGRPALALPGAVLFAAGQALAFTAGLAAAPLFYLATGLATAGFVLAVANLPARLPALERLGPLTMPIYVSHVIFAAAVRVALQIAGVTSVPVHLVAGVAAGIAGPLLLWSVAHRLGLAAALGLGGAGRARMAQAGAAS
ncbi:acyltransferase family protein [Wenxinia marina]|uniref:Fucose 4-O-acetylase n=1 Tax=Wenxinia marina DSM 24838 TaxID=1123501 RepID=A0A0D0PC61_9RHOB|nr:acyltransferase [Wenxinia marina]KIQ69036.1 Fucose 4-O-acetylase [Wenxinia marina DSM 24838]GGL69857.1 hypothetical protein GCM10011392_25450 [Wenxinia marina]